MYYDRTKTKIKTSNKTINLPATVPRPRKDKYQTKANQAQTPKL